MPQLSPIFWSMFPIIMFILVMMCFSLLFWWGEGENLLEGVDKMMELKEWLW